MESLSENLSVVYVRIQYFLTISRRKRDGKGCDWSSNKILSGNATRFDFGPYLLSMLFTLHRTNKIPNRIFKSFGSLFTKLFTNILLSTYKIDRAENAYPTSRRRTLNARAGVSLDLGIRGYSPGSFGNSPGSLCRKKKIIMLKVAP